MILHTDKKLCPLAIHSPKREQGTTLFMTLMLLLAFSLLGFNSMKGTGIHTRIAANHIATERTFQAAESSLDRIFLEGTQRDTDRFVKAMVFGIQQDCISRDNFLSQKCSRTDVFDSYGKFSTQHGNTLIAGTETTYLGETTAAGYDTRHFSFQRFATQGASFYSPDRRVGFATENQLNWKRFGPKGSFARAN